MGHEEDEKNDTYFLPHWQRHLKKKKQADTLLAGF